jgi:chromosome segregation ATPase
MAFTPTNDTFKQVLIEENIKYQMKFKTLQEALSKLQKKYNNDIAKLAAQIQEKEAEIATLKQKNLKILMESGSLVSRCHKLSTEKQHFEEENTKLNIKNDELRRYLLELEIKYETLSSSYEQLKHQSETNNIEQEKIKFEQLLVKYNKLSDQNIKDIQELTKIIETFVNDNVALKKKIIEEEQKFKELNNYLQNSYEIIYKLSSQAQLK